MPGRNYIEFTCPKCGGHNPEEIMVNITVASGIDRLWRDEAGIVQVGYGEQTNDYDGGDGGHVDRYQCEGCGYTIVDDKSRHAEDGLDEAALASAIEELNRIERKGELVCANELVDRIADAHRGLSGQELADIWNGIFPGMEVVYDGDSLFWVKQEGPG